MSRKGAKIMIVRIHMDDQYRLGDDAVAEVDRLDEQLMGAINASDQDAFSRSLDELLGYVRARGEKVPVDEIVSSDIILPSEDVTMEEARAILEKDAEMGGADTQAAPPA
jgi:PspAA-like protein